MKLVLRDSAGMRTASCGANEVMEDINRTYSGKQRWPWCGFLAVQVGIILWISWAGEYKTNSPLPIVLVGAAAVLLSVLMTLSSWKDWLSRRQRLRLLRVMLDCSGDTLEPRTSPDQSMLKTTTRRRNAWFTCGVGGGILLYGALSWADLLRTEQSARNIPAVLVLSLWWIFCITKTYWYELTARNLKRDKSGGIFAELLIRNRCPYALYLRNFKPEEDLADAMPRGEFEPAPNEVPGAEKNVLKRIGEEIPILAMSHPRDFNSYPFAIRLPIEGQDWPEKFTHYASHAAVLVLKLDQRSGGIMFELDWIRYHGAGERVVLVARRRIINSLRDESGSPIAGIRWVAPYENSKTAVGYPASFSRYLSDLGSKQAIIEVRT